MTRVIVHAGFHKTGTTTVQKFLTRNGKHIWPHSAIVIQPRISHALQMATSYSGGTGQLFLDEFYHRFCDFLGSLELGTKRHLCISAENLCGFIPGKNDQILNYKYSPQLLKTAVECIKDVIDPDPQLTLYFSTRDKGDWLRSLWSHNVRKNRLTEGLNEFSNRIGAVCDLENTIAEINAMLPGYPVITSSLEKTTTEEFGPATPIINLLDLPEDTKSRLRTIAPENVSSPIHLAEKMLVLNRSAISNSALKERKAALFNQAGSNRKTRN